MCKFDVSMKYCFKSINGSLSTVSLVWKHHIMSSFSLWFEVFSVYGFKHLTILWFISDVLGAEKLSHSLICLECSRKKKKNMSCYYMDEVKIILVQLNNKHSLFLLIRWSFPSGADTDRRHSTLRLYKRFLYRCKYPVFHVSI